MSSRPFQLFSVALVICGSKFVVAIFDRDGVTVSTDYDMWQDTAMFARVVLQITFRLSPVQLGADPSVQELEANSTLYDQIRKKSKALHVSLKSIMFPSYRIHCPRQVRPRPATPFSTTNEVPWVTDQWVTIGPPIWCSLSLCGRATNVWRVVRMEDGRIPYIDHVCILKNAWRRSDRDSESAIYQSIKTPPAGVAKFLQGGDVIAPGSANVIRVDLLRAPQLSDQPTLILHRLVLETAGRALWESNSYLEIVKGVRAALIGHQDLFNQNILHRDISPGNILLSVEPSPIPGEEGFLTDLEFARISTIITQDTQESSRRDGTNVHSTHTKWRDAQRGAVMTGTIHFMAIQLVEAMDNGKAIKHEVHHDVESIIWVLAYAIARRLINVNSKAEDDEIKNKISMFFAAAWGGGSLNAIVTAKQALKPLQPPELICPLLPSPILLAFDQLYILMHQQMIRDAQIRQMKRDKLDPPSLPVQGGPLTHKVILGILDECVENFGSLDDVGPK
ncbi:hypothetical protein HGRIS_001371 [Hohenbuehelia grisea]|uniref:Fungal-type protein kinase domain-containing protein n=1 Tax=Hohenbuehelia grisea TaxID=104357 RepID=A0ABR3JQH5_9AGAR